MERGEKLLIAACLLIGLGVAVYSLSDPFGQRLGQREQAWLLTILVRSWWLLLAIVVVSAWTLGGWLLRRFKQR